MRRQILSIALAGLCVVGMGAGGGAVLKAKKPAYLDCFSDKVMIYPGEKAVSWEELLRPGNAVGQFITDIEAHKTERYLVVLVRPGSVKFYRAMRRVASQHPVDVVTEAVDSTEAGQWDAQTGQLMLGKNKQVATTGIDLGEHERIMARSPVFFECRDNQVFYIDKQGLDAQVQQLFKTLPSSAKSGDMQAFIKSVNGKEVGNDYYKVVTNYLLSGIMALEARPGVKGEGTAALRQDGSEFKKALAALNQKDQYAVFLVRDNAFAVFRASRQEARRAGLETNWELLATDEPIKFGTPVKPLVLW